MNISMMVEFSFAFNPALGWICQRVCTGSRIASRRGSSASGLSRNKFALELLLLFQSQLPWGGYEEDHSFFRANRERCSPICTFPREDIPFIQGAISAFYEGDVFFPCTVPMGTVPVIKAQSMP